MKFHRFFLLIFIVIFLDNSIYVSEQPTANAQAGEYYVATAGSDEIGDGSVTDPWATIEHALGEVPDGSIILVRPGTYTGRISLQGNFTQGVTVRSELPYQAQLRNNDRVIVSYSGCEGVTLEGFDIAHDGASAGPLVIHLDGGGTNAHTSRITLRNNILHDSYNNDILKINNNARDILVEGNMFYNQAGSDEHIDVNSVKDVVIQDNVFFNDFAGSGRIDDDTSSFIVIKDSNESSDGVEGSEDIIVRRNVFLHWEGSSGQGFVRAGEDGQDFFEAKDVLIENNLMLGNNTQQIRSPFQLMNVNNVTIRANTVVGNMPAKEFGARIFTYGTNAPNNDQIHLHNNIWVDPTGTMGDTFNRGNNTDNLTFDNNLFWNAGNPFPTSSESIIEVSDDANRVIDDPFLGDQAGLVLPRWVPASLQFADRSTSIRQVFEQLVALYGTPAAGSPAIDAADPAFAPTEDILGNPRPVGLGADIGAYEYQGYGFRLSVTPRFHTIEAGESAIYMIDLRSQGGFTETITLSVSPPSPSLTLALNPVSLDPPGQAVLTVTDTHTTAPTTGIWYSIPITGTVDEMVEQITVDLLVGGTRVYLPLVRR
jgi:hypothetical protein